MTTSRLLALVVGGHLVSDRLEIDPRAPLVVDHNPVHSRQDVEVLRAAHRLSAHRFLDRKVGGPPLSLPAPDVPSAVVLGHPAPRSVRFGNGQGVLAAFGEHRAVLADALGVRFAPRPVPTTLPLWREEQRRLDVPARPQEAPISTITITITITVDGQSGPWRTFTAGSRHSARRTSGYTSHRIGLTHLTHGYLRTCHRGNPFANNIFHNQSGRSLQVQVPSQNLRRATVIIRSTKRPQRCRRGDVEMRDQCPTERCGSIPKSVLITSGGPPPWAHQRGASHHREGRPLDAPPVNSSRLLITPNQTRTAGRRHVRL